MYAYACTRESEKRVKSKRQGGKEIIGKKKKRKMMIERGVEIERKRQKVVMNTWVERERTECKMLENSRGREEIKKEWKGENGKRSRNVNFFSFLFK